MDEKYTVRTAKQDYPAARFRDANIIACMLETENVKFGIWSHLIGEYVDDKRPDAVETPIQNAPLTKVRKKARSLKCEASNYKVMQNDIYLSGFAHIVDPKDRSCIAVEGYCSFCGKFVKMRRFGNVGLIPLHNMPNDSTGE